MTIKQFYSLMPEALSLALVDDKASRLQMAEEYAQVVLLGDTLYPDLVYVQEVIVHAFSSLDIDEIIPTSFWRSERHNKLIHGAKNSYHIKGQALDFAYPKVEPSKLNAQLKKSCVIYNCVLKEFIVGKTYIHVAIVHTFE